MEFAWLKPGRFTMGSLQSEVGRGKDEGPRHQVVLTEGFYMGTHEVTQGQWIAVMGTVPWLGEDFLQLGPAYPAVYISWQDTQDFVRALNLAAEDSLYRLPTESEWEYAARGGLEDNRYPWGDKEPDGSQCNYADKNADQTLREMDKTCTWADMSVDDGYARCAPVGIYPPNGYGLYDMAGNVSEWCQDVYNQNYYSVSPAKNPSGPSRGEKRVLRGGSWDIFPPTLRLAARSSFNPDNRAYDHGFRCVSGSN